MKKSKILIAILAAISLLIFSPITGTNFTGQCITSQAKGVTSGQQNALQQAKNYLSIYAFSKNGLIKQLKYEGYSSSEAKYAVKHCGANWKAQAVQKALDYLDTTAFSKSGLIKQLKYEGFTAKQAKYGVSLCGANWKKQAVKKAKEYLNYMSFSKSRLISQLEYEGFTKEQAKYAVKKAY